MITPQKTFNYKNLIIIVNLILAACGGGGGGGGGGNQISSDKALDAIESGTSGSGDTTDGGNTTATGGGGSSSTVRGGGNETSTIAGVATGATSEGSTNAVSGKLTYAGGSFARPASMQGVYGTFTFNESTGDWTYLVDSARAATIALATGQSVIDRLVITTADKLATRTVTVTVVGLSSGNAVGIPLVQSVPTASYSGAYAADKMAVFNMLNADRHRCGFGKVAQNAKLDQAAQAHSDYLATHRLDNSHYASATLPGYTGDRPGDRIKAAGYDFSYSAEILHQGDWGSIFASGINAGHRPVHEFRATNLLKIHYSSIYHLTGAMTRSTEVGVGVTSYSGNAYGNFQTKILNIDFAIPREIAREGQQPRSTEVRTFPCEGSQGLIPTFRLESPDPFPNVPDRSVYPYGHPIYVNVTLGNTLKVTSGSVTLRNGASVPTTILDASNDPNKMLTAHEAFLVPTVRLADNSTYDVVIEGTNGGVSFAKRFSFSTATDLSE